jgi:hypothetical protein
VKRPEGVKWGKRGRRRRTFASEALDGGTTALTISMELNGGRERAHPMPVSDPTPVTMPTLPRNLPSPGGEEKCVLTCSRRLRVRC